MNEREPLGRTIGLALALLAISIGLTVWQGNARKAGQRSLPETGVALVFSPIGIATRWTFDSVGNIGTGIFSASSLKRENEALRAELSALSAYSETTSRLQREVETLRSLNKLPIGAGRKRVLADVRGYTPLDNSITLGAGSNRGVKEGQPVVSADGLLAIVRTVGPLECQASLITSAATTIGAVAVSHNPPLAGLIRGENATTLTLTFADPNAPVVIGDRIETTGYSEKIPQGLLIGRVLQVQEVPELGARTATIFPAARIGGVTEVAILQ